MVSLNKKVVGFTTFQSTEYFAEIFFSVLEQGSLADPS